MQKAGIRNWTVIGNCLVGESIDHPKLGSGRTIRTSSIVALDLDRKVCVTLNTIYSLEGECYGAEYQPDAEVTSEDNRRAIRVFDDFTGESYYGFNMKLNLARHPHLMNALESFVRVCQDTRKEAAERSGKEG